MVTIAGFPDYFFCRKSGGIFSNKGGQLIELKPLSNRTKSKTYALYKNGQRYELSLFEILKASIKNAENSIARKRV